MDKLTTPIYVDLVNEKDKTALLGYVEVETIEEAQKYLKENYPEHTINMIEKGIRLKL